MSTVDIDKIEQCVIEVFFDDLIMDAVADTTYTRKEMFIKLEELRTKLEEL